jgi:hypothetical protein
LSERGDWEEGVDFCTGFGVIEVLVGFSLAIVACVVVPMVEPSQGRSTSMKVNGAMMRSKIIIIIPPTARSLAFLLHGHRPIVGVPTHLCMGDVVVVVCCCSVSLNLIWMRKGVI